jgi:hypothetical protein
MTKPTVSIPKEAGKVVGITQIGNRMVIATEGGIYLINGGPENPYLETIALCEPKDPRPTAHAGKPRPLYADPSRLLRNTDGSVSVVAPDKADPVQS